MTNLVFRCRERDSERDKINREINRFLARGGNIEKCDSYNREKEVNGHEYRGKSKSI